MSGIFNSLKENIARYLNYRQESVRLNSIETIAKAMGYIAFGIALFFFFSFFLIFLSFGFATWLGDLFGNKVLGWLTAAGIYLLILIVLLPFKRVFIRFIAGKAAAFMISKNLFKKKKNRD